MAEGGQAWGRGGGVTIVKGSHASAFGVLEGRKVFVLIIDSWGGGSKSALAICLYDENAVSNLAVSGWSHETQKLPDYSA